VVAKIIAYQPITKEKHGFESTIIALMIFNKNFPSSCNVTTKTVVKGL